MKKTAFITGATSGIGWATAIKLASQGYRILAAGRRTERLAELGKQMPQGTDYYSISFDVRDREAVYESIEHLPESWKQIDLLINNAGNAHGLGPIYDGNEEDWEAMIDSNVKGLLYVTKAVVPLMLKKGTGHIVNVGSIAGKEVYLNGNVYCASKFAVDALNTGLRKELYNKGIKVSQVCPGLVETEFASVRFKGDKDRADAVYAGYTPLKPEDVADAIAYIVNAPAHVNVADMLLLPADQASSTEVNRK
jgi:NADP-dependent 3-hydroxy acid dehydrogenase YdfG